MSTNSPVISILGLLHESIWEFQFIYILANTWHGQSFLILAILTDVQWYLIVLWIFIYLMKSDVRHLFTWFLVICISFSEVSVWYFSIFKLGCFLIVEFGRFFILDTSPLSGQMVYKYFIPLYDLSFHSFNSIFQRAEVLNFGEV